MISVQNLSKSFDGVKVLDDISICFESGKIHGVVGRNGSGKTVLFKCICGLITYDCGVITIDGNIITSSNPPIGKIGALIESPGFLGNLTAKANLKILCDLSNTSYNRIPLVLEAVGLENDKKQLTKYSLGMKQKFGIAQALLEDPPIYIFDEPMNSLDDSTAFQIKELFFFLIRQGKTIIMASHIKEDIEQLCDTVTYLHLGKTAASI